MSGLCLLASYPKSGNTWLRLALSSLSRGGAPPDFAKADNASFIASGRGLFDLRLDVESSDLTEDEVTALRPRFYEEAARRATEPMLCKVHDAWTRTPAGEPLFPPAVTVASVCIVRDPRDVAVSLAHHMDTGIDDAIAFLGDPDAAISAKPTGCTPQLRQTLLTWSGHVRSWLGADPRPLLVRYEDMIADPAAALERVARHFGRDAAPEAVAKATAATRFDALRAAEERVGFLEKPWRAERFFRRGVAGGWRDTLTPAQAARIEDEHGGMMAELGYR